MTTTGKDFPVRSDAFRFSSETRASSAATSPACTECFDIFPAKPGDSDVINQMERLSSKEMKIAARLVWMAVGASCRSATVGMLVSRVGVRNLTLPERWSLSTSPWDLKARPQAPDDAVAVARLLGDQAEHKQAQRARIEHARPAPAPERAVRMTAEQAAKRRVRPAFGVVVSAGFRRAERRRHESILIGERDRAMPAARPRYGKIRRETPPLAGEGARPVIPGRSIRVLPVFRRVPLGLEPLEGLAVARLTLFALEGVERLCFFVELLQSLAPALFERRIAERRTIPAARWNGSVPRRQLRAAECSLCISARGSPQKVNEKRDAERVEEPEGGDDRKDLHRQRRVIAMLRPSPVLVFVRERPGAARGPGFSVTRHVGPFRFHPIYRMNCI